MRKKSTESLPAVTLKDTCVLPGTVIHFDIQKPDCVHSVEYAMSMDRRLFIAAEKKPDVEIPGLSDVYTTGTVSSVKQVMRLPQNIMRVMVEGESRARVKSFHMQDAYLCADVILMSEKPDIGKGNEEEAMVRSLKSCFSSYTNASDNISKNIVEQILDISDLPKLVRQISINLPLSFPKRQLLLDANPLSKQYEEISKILLDEADICSIQSELQQKIKERVDKNQKDYILREQLQVIREELGEDTSFSDTDTFSKQVQHLTASKSVKDKINEEIKRLKNTGVQSPEYAVTRGYIETLLSMPWDKAGKDDTDLKRAKAILERDHYGLEKVKERVVDFLAVRQLTKKGESPILCLVGPPGTGKTSIGRSIAEALGKKYVRISLGGVRDEAEIRGHRRTYIGAMPGRIATNLKKAGVKNPLFVLDEIDKVSSDYKGDTASALLEVLDSEQNSHFEDHYLEIPIDLSEVLFIATANDPQNIPVPLLDRMEIIEISSYTENEKMHIAREHLIPKQMSKNGLKDGQLSISEAALSDMITKYTREAGVRSLERLLGEICRKSARRILEEHKSKVNVTEKNLSAFLGNGRYTVNPANESNLVGIVRGLAWTSVGGETIEIEVNAMPGKGEFLLTGQLGDVMKESAQAGISYIRSTASKYGIKDSYFTHHDIHIHIPEGAVPKDGPSAGITMATAMVSAFTNRPVYANLAMTGEITLRGRVLPIGGLKEKLLAARKAGIQKVLVPKENRPDVEEISREITKNLTIVYVADMEQVLKEALADDKNKNS